MVEDRLEKLPAEEEKSSCHEEPIEEKANEQEIFSYEELLEELKPAAPVYDLENLGFCHTMDEKQELPFPNQHPLSLIIEQYHLP